MTLRISLNKTILFLGSIIFILVLSIPNGLLLSLNESNTVFQEIELLVKNNKINQDQAALYKVQALLTPEKLPDYLKDYAIERPFCGTLDLLDIYKQKEIMDPKIYNKIEGLILPSFPAETILDSELYPIRLHYSDGSSSEYVNAILSYAEQSYKVEIDDIGFIAPPPDGNSGGSDFYDIYFQDLPSGLGGYTYPIGIYRDVEWFSYTSSCVINSNLPIGDSLKGTIAHELNHSCQFSMDGAESLNIMEATATYIMNVVFPEINTNIGFLRYFQREPYRSIDYTSRNNVYVYGAFLFPRFLSEYYDANNPDFVLKIWEGTMQSGYTNEPDFLDAIQDLVYERKEHYFDDTFREFAKWRYFTGPNDDGKHFVDGEKYGSNSLVKIDRTFNSSALPLDAWSPSINPSEYGSTYVDFNLNDTFGGLYLEFRGDKDKKWSADMILFPNGSVETEYSEVVIKGDSLGNFLLNDLQGYEKVVLVISNLSDGDHDPDFNDWEGSNFTLDADIVFEQKGTVFTNKKSFVTGDKFKAELITMNTGGSKEVELVTALSIDGTFLYYPNWGYKFKKIPLVFEESGLNSEIIFDFLIDTDDLKGHFPFYTAILNKDTGELIGEVDISNVSINMMEPKAMLTVEPSVGDLYTIFKFDGSESYDARDPSSVLQIRWDWNSDGLWDTQYATRKIEYRIFEDTGIKRVTMEVKDLDGYTDQAEVTVDVLEN